MYRTKSKMVIEAGRVSQGANACETCLLTGNPLPRGPVVFLSRISAIFGCRMCLRRLPQLKHHRDTDMPRPRRLGTLLLLLAGLVIVIVKPGTKLWSIASKRIRRAAMLPKIPIRERKDWFRRQVDAYTISSSSSISECILLYGAFCNGNMGDVIQVSSMERLLASVAPGQCFWYAHPWTEWHGRGNRIGEFFSENISGNTSRLIHLTPDHVEEVNSFKGLVVGGGGILASNHAPLYVDSFVRDLTLPIVLLGVGANSEKGQTYTTLLEKAAFVSGRDEPSINAMSGLLQSAESPLVPPGGVHLVRDPVLSDSILTDKEGKCWKQSEGEHDQRLCFILPATNSRSTTEMSRLLVANVVRPGDVLVNVFPKHQQQILEKHDYPGEILQIVDPTEFRERLCACRAIVSTRFHGVILGLHMGVPTFGAAVVPRGNKVPEVLFETMHLPEQFLLVNEELTREVVDKKVCDLREEYATLGRRENIFAKLSALHDDFEEQAQHVLFDVIGVQEHKRRKQQTREGSEQVNISSENWTVEYLQPQLAKGRSAASPRRPRSSVAFASERDATPTVGDGRGVVTAPDFPNSVTGISPRPPIGPVGEALNAASLKPSMEVTASKLVGRPLLADKTSFDLSAWDVRQPVGETKRQLPSPTKPFVGTTTIGAEVSTRNGGMSVAEALILHGGVGKHRARLGSEDQSGSDDESAAKEATSLIDDCMAAFFLLAAIVGLSLSPLGGETRWPSNTSDKVKEAPSSGAGMAPNVESDDWSRASSDSAFASASSRSSLSPFPLQLGGRSFCARGVAAASPSKVLIAFNFAMWFVLAMGFSGYGKAYLSGTRDPVGLLVLQGAVGVMVLYLLGRYRVLNPYPGTDLALKTVRRPAAEATLLHTAQALLTNAGVLVGGVAVTTALKVMEPVAAAVLSYFFLGRTCSGPQAAALISIVAGVLLLTFSGSSSVGGGAEDGGGFLVAPAALTLVAVCCNALRDVVIKRVRPILPHQTLLACSAAACVVGVGLMLLRLVLRSIDHFLLAGDEARANDDDVGSGGSGGRDYSPRWLRMDGVNAALCFIGYNLASFKVLAHLSPVRHALSHSCKRMLVLAGGLVFLGEEMSGRQLGGVALAFVGVLAYNVAGAC